MTHVLVVRLDNDGDVLLAGPALRAVAAGAERVTLLCGPRGRQASALLPGVDEVLVWRAPWIDPEPDPVDRADVDALIARVGALRTDRALVLGSFHQSPLPTALVLRLAGVPWIGATSIDYPGSLLDLRHRIGDDVHEVERSLALVRSAGFALPPGDDGRLAVRRRGEQPVEGEYVVVHPGASVPARAWGPEAHAALVDVLVSSGRRVVVTGGPSERALTARVAGPPRDAVLDLGGATDLAGLADVIAGADAIVVGNTGPAHLAAAVGTPVVNLFAPTVPFGRWGPYRVPWVRLGNPVAACRDTRATRCPVPGHPCLSDVEPSDVVAAVDLLGAHRADARLEAAA
jgi:ADP-heptose:LPS heptosyltransferase